MKKTTIRSALAVLLAASTLTACGGSAASSAPASAAASSTAVAPAKQYTIGIAEAQANDETTVRRAYLENYIGPAYNVKFIFSEVLKDDAATKTFIENCADAGADAIIDFKSMSGQMCQICADNDMVYAISGNYIAHPEFLETDYPNFAGAVGSNNAELGSLFGTWLKDNVEADGTEGYLIATGIASSGNQQHIEIGQGILNGIADKYGLTFEQDIADLVTVAETTNAANDKGILVTLYPGSPNKETWLPGVSALIQTGQYNTFLSAGQTYNQSATVVDEVEKSFGIDIKVASVGALGQTLTTAFNTKDPFGNPSIDLATVKSTSVLTSALFAITYHLTPGEELFNVKEDPHEIHDLAEEKPELCWRAAWYLEHWVADNMLSNIYNYHEDPLWNVIAEGGPFHCRGYLKDYCKRLEDTGRGDCAEELRRRHKGELDE